MAQVHRLAGGAAGLGGTVGARMFLDEPGKDRFMQPSVLYGLGTGVAAAALWGLDATRTLDLDTTLLRGTSDFFASHAATALPAGGVSALLPKTSGTSTNGNSQALSEFFNDTQGAGSQPMNGQGDFASAAAGDYAEAQ